MAERALDDARDDALADLVEAFGYYSDAEIQAFLDATPSAVETDARLAAPGLLVASRFAPREAAAVMPTGRVQAVRA